MTASWLKSMVESPDRLGTIITYANWGIVSTLVIGAVLTAFVIWAGGERELLLAKVEQLKDQRIADARATAETARVEQQRLGLQIEQQRAENLKMQSVVEGERMERLRLQQRVLPRALTVQQKDQLSAALKGSPAGGLVGIGIYIGTDDGAAFAQALGEAIHGSMGWKAEGKGLFAMGANVRGQAIVVPDLNTVPPRAIALQKALAAVGIQAPIADTKQTDVPVAAGEIMLFVAPKP